MRDIDLMGIKPLDYGLSLVKRTLDVGRATLGKCHMRLISLLSGDICEKKFRRSDIKTCRSNTIYFSAHTEKN